MNQKSQEAVHTVPRYSVLFVCTANRCRSPMAEALWRREVEKLGESAEWRIGSAGTWTHDGYGAMPLTQAVLAEMEIDVLDHRSQVTERELLQEHNLILVMQRNHKEALQAEFPEIADRVFLLSEMSDQAFGISDPVAGTIDDYRHTAEQIRSLLQAGMPRIRQLARTDEPLGG